MEGNAPIGHRVILLDAVDSTNNYAAMALARQELRHGTAIMALEQTQGRGQRGRRWSTGRGLDLAASLVLLPQGFPASAQFDVAKAAALALHDVVAEAFREAGADPAEVRIKWPNDVLAGRNKLGGILIVNELQGPWLASCIVGIGLNANSSGWSREWQATSLLQETRRPQNLAGLLERLCARMEHWWRLLHGNPGPVSKAYADRLWAKGRFADLTLDGAPFTARIIDVDASGRLLVEDEAGEVAAYGLERLRLLR